MIARPHPRSFSLREKEEAAEAGLNSRLQKICRRLFPLPRGEGQGEGFPFQRKPMTPRNFPASLPQQFTSPIARAFTGGLALIFLAGCACPHRKAVACRTVELFEHRTDGLVRRESWRDQEGGGGFFLFTDPTVQAMTALHTNQSALGGGSAFVAGPMALVVDTNLIPAIAAFGTAAGNVIGATIKSAAKP